MARTLYELVGADDRRFSPFCWRTRMALAHKGLEFDCEPCGFTEKDRIAFAGHDRYPVLVDGARIVADSWVIAGYLDEAYPDRPPLFDGAGARRMVYFLNCWTDAVLHPAVLRVIVFDVFQHIRPVDKPGFRESREARFGKTLETLGAERDDRARDLEATLAPVRAVLGGQRWISGDAPAYGDYIVFGALQWPRCVSPYPVVAPDDPVHEWRDRMIALFGGLADSVPHYDY